MLYGAVVLSLVVVRELDISEFRGIRGLAKP